MAAQMIRARDKGVPIRVTIGVSEDLTGATGSLKFRVNGAVLVKPATIAGRVLTYTTTGSDFTTGGTVKVQAYIVLPSGQGRHTGKSMFIVEETL